MANIMPPQTITATCCVLPSAMRGTLRAREIVAKDRRPSITCQLTIIRDNRIRKWQSTYTLPQRSVSQDHTGSKILLQSS